MRIDKFLKVSRLIKRRSVAQDACAGGRVKKDGKSLKSSYDVKVGDILEIAFGEKTVRVQVLSLSESTKKEDAPLMYKLL